VSPGVDAALHSQLRLHDSELVTMLLAIGTPLQGLRVPRSPRRSIGAILHHI
jgi:hypothetical protein